MVEKVLGLVTQPLTQPFLFVTQPVRAKSATSVWGQLPDMCCHFIAFSKPEVCFFSVLFWPGSDRSI